MKDPMTKKDTLIDAVPVAASVVAEVIESLDPDRALLAAALPPGLDLVLKVALGHQRRRATALWKRIVQSDWETPEEVQGLLEAHADEPWGRETVIESVRKVLDAISDEAIGPMGSLAAEYLKARRRADAFLRGAMRVFADVSGPEIIDLAVMVQSLASVEAGLMSVERCGAHGGTFQLRIYPGAAAAQAGDTHSEHDKLIMLPCPVSYMRICHLLRASGLAHEAATGTWGSSSGPGVMVVEREVMRVLASHLRTVGS